MRYELSDIAPPAVLQKALEKKLPNPSFPWEGGIETIRFSIGDVLDGGVAEVETFRGEWEGWMKCRLSLHGPFLDLLPASTDPLIRQTAGSRFQSAYNTARALGAEEITFHSGFLPAPYGVGDWFSRSVSFWREFLSDKDGSVSIFLENVFDPEYALLARLLDEVNHPAFKLCLDVGHANVVSPHPVSEWITALGSRIGHVHLHNNDGVRDSHRGLTEGSLDMGQTIRLLEQTVPAATAVLEIPDGDSLLSSLRWLRDCGLYE